MNIELNGVTYTITETDTSWKIQTASGKLSVDYNIPKDMCKTFDEIVAYIEHMEDK